MGSFKAPCINELNTLVQAQEANMVPDEVGGEKTVWVDSIRFWAKVEWAKSRENVVAGRVQPWSYASVTARYDAAITTKTRLVLDDGTIINIRGGTNVEQRYTWMLLEGESGVGS